MNCDADPVSLTSRLTFSAKAGISTVANQLRDLILPPTCLACDVQVGEQGMVCASCWSNIRFIERPFCEVLGIPFSYDLGNGALSAQAIADLPVFDSARSVVLYDDVPRKMVQGLKFSNRTELAPWMAKWMIRASDGMLANDAVIVPVPLHRWRLIGRRFNQSAELARAVGLETGLRYCPEILTRIRATRQQVGLGLKERQRNVQGAFRVPVDQQIHVKGSNIVLIDDVFTTGATLRACARALRRKGAERIDCLTFARVASGVAVNDL